MSPPFQLDLATVRNAHCPDDISAEPNYRYLAAAAVTQNIASSVDMRRCIFYRKIRPWLMQFKPATKPAKPPEQPPAPSKDQAHGNVLGQPKNVLEVDLENVKN